MIQRIRFSSNHRVFKEGDILAFRPGLNLLVGDQGSGKSTLLGLFRELSSKGQQPKVCTIALSLTPSRVIAFDFEKDNPRIKGYLMDGDLGHFQIHGSFRSHGEVLRDVMSAVPQYEEHTVYLLDEPDMGLSPRSVHRLAKQLEGLVAGGHQVLAAVHNPILIQSAEYVLNLETKTWVKPEAFLESQMMGEYIPEVPSEKKSRRRMKS